MKFTKVFGLAAALTLMLAFSGCSKTELQNKSGDYLKADEVKVGDTVKFGNYKGSTDWKVLDIQDDKALLLSSDIIDINCYDEDSSEWETSELREWLNLEYYGQAFDEDQRSSIVIHDGDRVTLLTKNEVNEYFKKRTARIATVSEYVKEIGNGSSYNKSWWLKTPSTNSTRVYCVKASDYALGTTKVSIDNVGVRPAIWVDIG